MATAVFFPLSAQTQFDANGYPIVGGRLFFYDAQTTNPRTVYTTAALTTAHPFPVLTDAYGRVPIIYVGLGDYKVVIQDSDGAMITTIDNLPGGAADPVAPPTGTIIPPGRLMAAYSANVDDGWLPANGKTIGNATSSATARAAGDTQPLFVSLYNADANLTVLGGRGVSANSDYVAGKTIALPDLRGTILVGLDGMGNTLAGRLTTASTATPDQIGARGGVETVTLSGAQLPAISPAITVSAGGGVTPSGSTANSGAHTHTGTTDPNGDHTHGYQKQNGGIPYAASGSNPTPADNGSTTNQTGVAGAHTHTLTLASGGTHSHALVMDALPTHTHTATIAALGSGTAHANMPPFVEIYWHIKL